MNTHEIQLFLGGAMTTAHWIAALFFVRYWRRTRDQLFLMFAIAFGLFGVQRIALASVSDVVGIHDVSLWPYIVRLVAFVTILWAIIRKNRTASAG